MKHKAISRFYLQLILYASFCAPYKSVDYKYFVYTNAALLAAMGRDFKAANKYGLLADANDPNSWKPAVSNTLYCVYSMYMLRKLMAERSTPDVLIDLAGGAASIYHTSK
ncbi:hypothetical protein [Segatella oris]|uniref:hypothetical protein n=1 Tax=Segatella oris TaxID=28135 RepID=UPI0028E95729|nr:hypothetical protein [Segatella oris]